VQCDTIRQGDEPGLMRKSGGTRKTVDATRDERRYHDRNDFPQTIGCLSACCCAFLGNWTAVYPQGGEVHLAQDETHPWHVRKLCNECPAFFNEEPVNERVQHQETHREFHESTVYVVVAVSKQLSLAGVRPTPHTYSAGSAKAQVTTGRRMRRVVRSISSTILA
jgi:hypothetical protein